VRVVAVVGGGSATAADAAEARTLGRRLAQAGVVVATGGRGGIMEAASRGAVEAGGITIGILPGGGPEESPPNPWVRIPVFTGLGDARNAVLVRSAQVVVAVGGGFGTLSEIGLALKAGRPAILVGSWRLEPPAPIAELAALLRRAADGEEAADLALSLLPHA